GLPGHARRHGSRPHGRVRPDPAPRAAPPRLQELVGRGGPLSPPYPKTRGITPHGADRARPTPAAPCPAPPLAADLLPSPTPTQPPTYPPRGRTFSLNS